MYHSFLIHSSKETRIERDTCTPMFIKNFKRYFMVRLLFIATRITSPFPNSLYNSSVLEPLVILHMQANVGPFFYASEDALTRLHKAASKYSLWRFLFPSLMLGTPIHPYRSVPISMSYLRPLQRAQYFNQQHIFTSF